MGEQVKENLERLHVFESVLETGDSLREENLLQKETIEELKEGEGENTRKEGEGENTRGKGTENLPEQTLLEQIREETDVEVKDNLISEENENREVQQEQRELLKEAVDEDSG